MSSVSLQLQYCTIAHTILLLPRCIIANFRTLYGHFGPRTFRHQDTSALNFGAEVSEQFGTGAEVSVGQSDTDLYETLRPHYTRITLFEERFTDFQLRQISQPRNMIGYKSTVLYTLVISVFQFLLR